MPAKLKLTYALVEQIVELKRDGLCDADIIAAIGVHQATFYRWLKEGENAKTGVKRALYEEPKRPKRYGGTLSSEECMRLCGISRNTYFSYCREIDEGGLTTSDTSVIRRTHCWQCRKYVWRSPYNGIAATIKVVSLG